jgi:hemolysin activation/secretion protein
MDKSLKKFPNKPTFTSYFQNFRFGILLFVASFFVATSFFTHKAKAQTQIIEQQDWITRNQQNILEEKKREREFDAISKEHEHKKEEDEKQSKKSESLISGKIPSCVKIKEVNLLNAKSLSNFRQQKIVSPFIGKCVEAEILASIIKAVNDYYQSQGFASTQVKVPKQNLQSGIFELQIIEGKIEKISFGKDRFVEKMQELTAFGIAKGNVLNLNDINQGMYQINRLQSNSAVIKIEPGSEIGESVVKIDNNKKFPAKFTVGKDNLGNKFTGIQRTNFSTSFDNLLFLNVTVRRSTFPIENCHKRLRERSFKFNFIQKR